MKFSVQWQGIDIQKKEQGAQSEALWHTTQDCISVRLSIIACGELFVFV